jgi:hypothetical protein
MDSWYVLPERLQFHILRHFTDPGEEYLNSFLEKSGYSRQDVDEQLKLHGSKFHSHFASDPLQLWEIIKERVRYGQSRSWFTKNRKVFSFEFDKEEYPGGIGNEALIAVKDLDEKEKHLIRLEERDGFAVQTLSGTGLRPTWQFHLVVILSEEPFISTIFPGTYAPPFPDAKTQEKEEYLENELFWRSHVLIR